MPKPLRFLAATLATSLIAGATGCTLFPQKNPPTLATTTSAAEHDRILWQMAQKGQWDRISPLLSTTLVWSVNGRSLNAGEVVPYLKSLNLRDAVVRDAAFQPNGPDMTVTYTLQLSDGGGAPQTYLVMSVWQQIKSGGYILIAHSQQPLAVAPTATAGR